MKIYQWRSSLLESELTSNAKLIGIVISEFYREGKDCYPSLPTILRFTSFGSVNTVRNGITELKENNFIGVGEKKRNRMGGKPCNLYIFYGLDEQLSSGDSSNDSSSERSDDSSPRDSEITKSTKSIKEDNVQNFFNTFYSEYPLKKSKAKSETKFYSLLNNSKEPEKLFNEIMNGLAKYKQDIEEKGTEKKFIKHPITWLNGECWNDEYTTDINQNLPRY